MQKHDSNATHWFRLWARRRMKTLYQQLGVTPQASPTAIQQSYFRLAKKLDPKNTQDEASDHASAEYQAIKHAYRTLSNSNLRAEYDRSLLEQSAKSGPKK